MKKILLHTCCAPCTAPVHDELNNNFHVTAFYFNPNIAPRSEYIKRLEELKRYAEIRSLEVIDADYCVRIWTSHVKAFRKLRERSERCWRCYHFRLEETFKYAKQNGYDMVATTLSISPHKDAGQINAIGKKLESVYSVPFLEADFKKNGGFEKSTALSRELGFYRQQYCGCVYSLEERKKQSSWREKIKIS